ncbi:hypothetical protein RDI58_026818 [Solanum bulbocastanum]|uniref:Uncharacterized protein n=1 Tax=Solanum bulbocastanum TaxID=147425 RepID=A0AAN8SZR6_SOLBU
MLITTIYDHKGIKLSDSRLVEQE